MRTPPGLLLTAQSMDHHAPDNKRPRLSTWSANPHHGVLPHPAPREYQPPPHPFARDHPPPPPPPLHTNQHFDDRRRHEQDHYPQQRQDHRQPPPSPAHPPHYPPTYSPREPPGGMKRDPDDALPQLRRPHSTGTGAPEPNVPGTPLSHTAQPPPHQQHPPPPPPPHHQQHQQQHHHQQHPQQQQQHQSHPPPQQSPMDDRRHMSFDAGPSPHIYHRPPSYPPPTPHPHSQPPQSQPQQQQQQQQQPQPPQVQQPAPPQTPYEPSPQMYGGPPSAGAQDGGIYLTTFSSAAAKRKAQRASQACENCRQLKAKCDETKPCKNCREKKTECKYRDPIPKQQDKVQAEVLEGINFLKDYMLNISERLERLEEAHRLGPRPEGIKKEPIEMDETVSPSMATEMVHPDTAIPSVHEGSNDALDEPMSEAPPMGMGLAQGGEDQEFPPDSATQENEEHIESPPRSPRSPVPPGKPAIPSKHTTGAGLLLKWPAVNAMMGHLLEAEEGINTKHLHEYPLKNEEERGLLHIYGRGEGRGEGRRKVPRDTGLGKDSILDIGSIPTGPDSPDPGPSPSPSNDWGHIGGFIGDTPHSVTSDGKPSRGKAGELDLDQRTVWALVNSYEDNIQNMHPIILKSDLHGIVHKFLASVSSASVSSKGSKTSVAGFTTEETGQKRRRGDSSDGAGDPGTPPYKVQRMSRHIQTAVVLCVLALGKICLHKEPLPDVVPSSPESSQPAGSMGSPAMGRNGAPSSPTTQGSPPAMAVQSILSPSADPERATPASRRSSFQGQNPFRLSQAKRNMDVIPGLDYLAVATDILGNQQGGCTFWHIYAHLLAGLYYGQLGRVLESYSHITAASTKAQQLMRGEFGRLIEGHERGVPLNSAADTRFFFLFWSCMQLESDIIAELHLPQSGISTYEENMPLPPLNGATANGIDERVAKSYLGQLYLRKQLNKAHTLLYGDRTERAHYRGMLDMINQLSDMIDPNLWVAPVFKFDPQNDPPATDILDARLRAKFWGATNIICRPVIKSILNQKYKEGEKTLEEEDWSDPINEEVNPHDPEILKFASRGIRALIESTRAFHGLKERRFIITNVFGTAHAQWGNLITLAAVYRDSNLNQFVDPNELSMLFQRTIDFLGSVAHRSSALSIDRKLLIGLRDSLNLPPPALAPPLNLSFTSTSSGHQHPTPSPSTPVQDGSMRFATPLPPQYAGRQQQPQPQQQQQQPQQQQQQQFASPDRHPQGSP